MNARSITVAPMREVTVGLKPRMRALSLGPIAWGFWSWTFQDGSCWAALGFNGYNTDESALVGWAALTQEVDVLPVVGCFVDESQRGTGLGGTLVSTLLRSLLDAGHLYNGAAVFASTWRWSRYETLIESCGLRCIAWK